jgi:hypothetical protein
MKTYVVVDVYIHVFLISAIVGGEWSALRSGCFTPGDHWIGGWVGLDDVKRRKVLPLLGFELRPLGRPARGQSLSRILSVKTI